MTDRDRDVRERCAEIAMQYAEAFDRRSDRWTAAVTIGLAIRALDLPLTSAVTHDPGHPHLIDGEFQSDKYPTCPRGKVPLSVKDKTAQDLLWEYAQRRRAVDAEFAADLEIALTRNGYTVLTSAREVTDEMVKHAMLDAWNEICSDTDCHPLDLERKGRELFFTPQHWASSTAAYLRAALASAPQPACVGGEELTIADYEASFADHRRLCRELDVALNGDGAAEQASLCDLVGQAFDVSRALGRPALSPAPSPQAGGEANQPTTENINMPNVIALGEGNFVINHGYWGEDAALFIEPASAPGEVGTDASGSGLSKTECVDGGTVITFGNLASADVLRAEMESAIKRIGTRRGMGPLSARREG